MIARRLVAWVAAPIALAPLLALLALLSCARDAPRPVADEVVEATAKDFTLPVPPSCVGDGTPLFDDVTEAAGVVHAHRIPTGLPWYERNVGGGAALDDLDGDGDLDLFVSNGSGPKSLFLNRGDGTFTQFAAHASATYPDDWTNGVSAADYDNDGDQDLLLVNRGKSRLLRNEGGARFVDVTDTVGLDASSTGASASWGDLDGDGFVDLLIANTSLHFHPIRENPAPARSRIFRNVGGVRFVDVSGKVAPEGLPLGSSFLGTLADLDGDGDVDVLLTEEFGDHASANHVLKNAGPDGAGWVRLEMVETETGAELPYAAMGVAVLDVDGDALPDLFLSNLATDTPEREVLLHNDGHLHFTDVAGARGAYAMSVAGTPWFGRRTSSWGPIAFDLENDGDDDLFVVYGAWTAGPDYDLDGSIYTPMSEGQPDALLRNDRGRFSVLAGTCVEGAGRGRGVVAGDVDGDGCIDLYVVNQDGPARLYRRRCEGVGRSIAVKLRGTRSNRDGIGAAVTITAGGSRQTKWVLGGSTSVHSSQPKRLHFGVGDAPSIDAIHVRWPSGVEQEVGASEAGRIVEIVEP